MNDPYSVPHSESSNYEKENQPNRGYLFWIWPVLLAVNLIFPLRQFQGLPYQVSWAGIFTGIIIFWFIGCLVCFRSPAVALRLIVGSVFMAFTQFIPIIQYLVGLISFEVLNRSGLYSDTPNLVAKTGNFPAALFVTSVYGLIFTLITMFVGWAIVAIYSFFLGATRKKPVMKT